MFDTIGGLPLHPLVVHATEVVVPTAALVLLLAAVWPAFRRWAGVLPLGLALVGLVLVPVSLQSGEGLEHIVGETDLVETHSGLAEGLLPWMILLVAVAAALLWWTWGERRPGATPRSPRWVALVLVLAAVVGSVGTTVQAVMIGHSGATATWSEDMSNPAPAGEDSDD